MTLNEKIFSIVNDRVRSYDNYPIMGKQGAANEIEKLVIQEQLDMLNAFYYGEDLNDADVFDFYNRVLETSKEDLRKRLNELNGSLK